MSFRVSGKVGLSLTHALIFRLGTAGRAVELGISWVSSLLPAVPTCINHLLYLPSAQPLALPHARHPTNTRPMSRNAVRKSKNICLMMIVCTVAGSATETEGTPMAVDGK